MMDLSLSVVRRRGASRGRGRGQSRGFGRGRGYARGRNQGNRRTGRAMARSRNINSEQASGVPISDLDINGDSKPFFVNANVNLDQHIQAQKRTQCHMITASIHII